MPRVAPRWCGPRLSRRRALRTRLMVLGGSACGHRLGAEVRSSRPAGPCSRYRRTHLWAVALDTPAASAAETTDHPISCTRCTISRRPNGVSFALRWGTESLLSREGPCQPFTVTGGSPVSTTFVGTTTSRRYHPVLGRAVRPRHGYVVGGGEHGHGPGRGHRDPPSDQQGPGGRGTRRGLPALGRA